MHCGRAGHVTVLSRDPGAQRRSEKQPVETTAPPGDRRALRAARWEPKAKPRPAKALAGQLRRSTWRARNIAQRWTPSAKRAIAKPHSTRHLRRHSSLAETSAHVLVSSSGSAKRAAMTDRRGGTGGRGLPGTDVPHGGEAGAAERWGARVRVHRRGLEPRGERSARSPRSSSAWAAVAGETVHLLVHPRPRKNHARGNRRQAVARPVNATAPTNATAFLEGMGRAAPSVAAAVPGGAAAAVWRDGRDRDQRRAGPPAGR